MWRADLEELKGLKKDLRCIKYEVKKRPAEPPTVYKLGTTIEPSEVEDLREEIATAGSR
jgi:hypothetical protein